MTITEFLEARIAADEAQALAANAWASHGGPTQWIGQPGDGLVVRLGAGGPHIATHSPSRVLAECAAKRAIIKEHEETMINGTRWGCKADSYRPGRCPTLRALAAVYKDHPDYQQEWA